MQLISKNKRATYDYEISNKYNVGIVLLWHEVKSLRTWKINITDSVALFSSDDLWVHNLDIPLYEKANPNQISWHDPSRKRKLLLNKHELKKIRTLMNKSWATLIVLDIYFSEKQLVKLTLWLAKRKKNIQKREQIKNRDGKRQLQKSMRQY